MKYVGRIGWAYPKLSVNASLVIRTKAQGSKYDYHRFLHRKGVLTVKTCKRKLETSVELFSVCEKLPLSGVTTKTETAVRVG